MHITHNLAMHRAYSWMERLFVSLYEIINLAVKLDDLGALQLSYTKHCTCALKLYTSLPTQIFAQGVLQLVM